jgi:creatinine amidohydrolase
MTWMDVESYLEQDDRAVVPLGSTEQHAYLSLEVDNILSTRVATEAAEPLGVPVFPTVNYGLTPYFTAYPGTVTLRLGTYLNLLKDILDSLADAGFRRILLVNGHGGNSAGQSFAIEWMRDRPDVRVKWHNWWNAPATLAKVRDIDPEGSHASWMETFPWTRVEGAEPPEGGKPMVDLERMRLMSPELVREYLGDGNMGGVYRKSDEVMHELWQVGVEETRAALEGPWS